MTAADAKYTKGPWRQFVAADGLYAIAADEKPGSLIVVAREVDNEDDARLIAAAPDLVEALKHIKRMPGPVIDGPSGPAKFLAYDAVVEAINAVLSKAGV